MQITNMSLKDLNNIKNILQTDFDNFYTYNTLKNDLSHPNYKYISAKQNNNIIGFAGLWILFKEAHITNIVVKKDLRHSGVGSLLLKKLIDICKNLNLDSLTLEVNENNIPAIKLYEKFQFKKIGIRKNYYPNFTNAIIMTKTLNKA